MIREIQPSGPYALLGWCNGGAMAFETARQLRQAGEVVTRIFVIDTWVPGYLKRLGWLRSRLSHYNYRWKLILTDWAKARAGRKSYWAFLGDRATLRRLTRHAQGEERVPEQPDYAAAQAYDHWLLDYTTAMLKEYEPGHVGAGVTVIRSKLEPTGRFLDPKLGWGGFAEEVDLVVVPGDHHTIFDEPGVSIMAKAIREAMCCDDEHALKGHSVVQA